MSFDPNLPAAARNFDVRFMLRGPRGGFIDQRTMAFSDVTMPPFRLDRRPAKPTLTLRDEAAETSQVGHDEHRRPTSTTDLVLRRGHTGSSELFELWRAERDGERGRLREVLVVLMDGELRPVTAWQFRGCRVVGLEYSPLDALHGGILMETLEARSRRSSRSTLAAEAPVGYAAGSRPDCGRIVDARRSRRPNDAEERR